MTDVSETKLLRVADAARQAGVRPETVWRWIRQERIPASAVVRFGPRTVRLNAVRFAAVLKERETDHYTP